jgi:ribosomal protein S18 acetylase RimI-like enzyme
MRERYQGVQALFNADLQAQMGFADREGWLIMSNEEIIYSHEEADRLWMERFDFRPAEPDDAAQLVLLSEQAIAARKGLPIPEQVKDTGSIERNQELLSKDTTWSRLVFDGPKLVGFALGLPATDPTTGQVIAKREHLSLLMIDPKHWGEGIGSNLLDWIDNELAGRGVEAIDLWTESDNTRAQTLYERKGYRATGLEQIHHIYGEHQVQYEKTL